MNDHRIEQLNSIEDQKAFILAVIEEAKQIERNRPRTQEEKFGYQVPAEPVVDTPEAA